MIARLLVLEVRKESHAGASRAEKGQRTKQKCNFINHLAKTDDLRVEILGNNVELDKDAQHHTDVIYKGSFQRLSNDYTHLRLSFNLFHALFERMGPIGDPNAESLLDLGLVEH